MPIPVNSRYALTERTSNSPPIIIGLPKSVNDPTKTRSQDANIPGNARGSVTVKKVFILFAPKFIAHVSRSGSIA